MFSFKVTADKNLNKIKIIKNDIFRDLRGDLFTIINYQIQKDLIKKKFNNYFDKIAIRKKNTLTGIHFDNKSWKLITCVNGVILVILVDCNRKSKTYLKYTQIILNTKNKSILVPPGYGVSYLCRSKESFIFYKYLFNGKYIDADKQSTLSWRDKRINIKWPIKKPILSKRDNI
tara:strand:- start:79 stop:600 length:522 start_codon:yes stop_codon:yes gene_type:complete